MESPWELRLEHSNIDSIPEVLKCIKITEDTTFGRCPTSNVVIPSAYMSRRSDHCKVFLRDGALMIYSFPSLNPTFVNLEGMVAGTERQLYPGDRIGLGISAHMTQSAYVYAVHNTEPIVKEEEENEEVVIISDSEEESPTIHFPSPVATVSLGGLVSAIPRPFPSYSSISVPSLALNTGPSNDATSLSSSIASTSAVKESSTTIPTTVKLPSTTFGTTSAVKEQTTTIPTTLKVSSNATSAIKESSTTIPTTVKTLSRAIETTSAEKESPRPVASTVKVPSSATRTVDALAGPSIVTPRTSSASAKPSSSLEYPIVPNAEPVSSDDDISVPDSVQSDSDIQKNGVQLKANKKFESVPKSVEVSIGCDFVSQASKKSPQSSISSVTNDEDTTSNRALKQSSRLPNGSIEKSSKAMKTSTEKTSSSSKPFNLFGSSDEDEVRLRKNHKTSSLKSSSSESKTSDKSKTSGKQKSTKSFQKVELEAPSEDKKEKSISKKKKNQSNNNPEEANTTKVSRQEFLQRSTSHTAQKHTGLTTEVVSQKIKSSSNDISKYQSSGTSKSAISSCKVIKERVEPYPKTDKEKSSSAATSSTNEHKSEKKKKKAHNKEVASKSQEQKKKPKQESSLEKYHLKECSVVLQNLSQEDVEKFTKRPTKSEAGNILKPSKRFRLQSSSSEEDIRYLKKSKKKLLKKPKMKTKFSRIRIETSSDSSSESSPENLHLSPNSNSSTLKTTKLKIGKANLLSPEKLNVRRTNDDSHSDGSIIQSTANKKVLKKTSENEAKSTKTTIGLESDKNKEEKHLKKHVKTSEKTRKSCSDKNESSLESSAEKRKSTHESSSSSVSKKMKTSNNQSADVLSTKLRNSGSHVTKEATTDSEVPLADFETVYVKQEPEWDFSQYTQDDEIVILDDFNDTKSHEMSISNSHQNSKIKNHSQKARDLPFDNEFSWLVNSQNEEIFETEECKPNGKELKEVVDLSDESSDGKIFEARKAIASTSTPKVKSKFQSIIFGGDDGTKDCSDEKSLSATCDVSEFSDSPSEAESSGGGAPEHPQEVSTSDASGDEDVTEARQKAFEDEDDDIFEKKKDKAKKLVPLLINALPLKPRRQRPPSGPVTEMTSKPHDMDNKLKSFLSRKKKEKEQTAIKPKAFYSDKIRKMTGQKTTNSNWIPDYNAGDKKAQKALKAERMKRLKDLEMKRPVEAESVATEANKCFSMDVPDNAREENADDANAKVEVSKITVKITKHNRGTFLTEDVPAGKKTSSSKELKSSSPDKVFLTESKVIVIRPEKSIKSNDKPLTASNKKSQESVEVCAEQVPKPSKSKKKSTEDPTNGHPGTLKTIVGQSKSSSKSKNNRSFLEELSINQSSSGNAKTHRKSHKVQSEKLSVEHNVAASSSHQPSLPLIAKQTNVPGITPSTSTGHHTSLLKSQKKKNSSEKRTSKKRVQFDDNIVVNEFEISDENSLHPVSNSTKTMTRHPLPEMKESGVEEEMRRVILSMLYWGTQWRNVELSVRFPPPVWKKDNILYTKTELLELRSKGLSIQQLRPNKDPLEEKQNLPPRACTIKFPSFQAYHKEWYRLLLLELWATVSCSPPTPVGKLYASIVSWEDTEGLFRCKEMKLTVPVCKDTQIADPPTAGNFVMLELIPPTEDSQSGVTRNVYKTFGYVEKDRMVEASSGVQKMHPETGKPVIKNIEIEILVKYREWDLTDYTATIETLAHAKTGLKNMQGLFELASSPLKEIILSPSLRNMTAPPMNEDKITFKVTDLMANLQMSPEQVQIAEKIANTLMQEKPSISVLEGPAGCGKTRVLIAVVMCLLHEHFFSPRSSQSRGRRVLVCLTNVESVNAFTFWLNHLRDCLQGARNKFNFVTIGPKDQLQGAALKHSLHNADIEKGYRTSEENLLVEDMMESDENILIANVNALKQKLEHIKSKSSHDAKLLQSALNDTEERLRQLKVGIDKSQSELTKKARMERRQREMLRNSEVIVTTLSQGLTVGPMISNFGPGKFAHTPICLIDDAHRAAEVQCLMPLMFGTRKMVLSGDLALPEAYMQSRFASELGLRNSLLRRITRALDMSRIETSQTTHQNSPEPLRKTKGSLPGLTYHRLTQQYRMCPRLAKLAVKNLELETQPPPPDPRWSNFPLRNYLVFDHNYPKPEPMSEAARSCWLDQEAKLAVTLLRSIQLHVGSNAKFNTMFLVPDEEYGGYIDKHLKMIGIKNQLQLSWHTILDLSIGMDAWVVIACLGDGRSPFHNLQHLTLALTRAKDSFIVVGHLDIFKCRPHWLKMLQSAEKYKALMSVTEETPPRALDFHMFLNEPSSPRSLTPTSETSDMELDTSTEEPGQV